VARGIAEASRARSRARGNDAIVDVVALTVIINPQLESDMPPVAVVGPKTSPTA
jgi:hypothetical protein